MYLHVKPAKNSTCYFHDILKDSVITNILIILAEMGELIKTNGRQFNWLLLHIYHLKMSLIRPVLNISVVIV